jgi:hypothetical protein
LAGWLEVIKLQASHAAHQASLMIDKYGIRLLQQRETTHIKWLKDVRRMRRHAESDNIILLTVLLEFERVVAIIAIDN